MSPDAAVTVQGGGFAATGTVLAALLTHWLIVSERPEATAMECKKGTGEWEAS